MTATDLLEDYLLLWILLSVGVGLAVPSVAVVTRASTLLLAVMIGSISLTLSVDQFRRIRPRTLGFVLAGHVTMPFLAFGVARGLGLSPELTVGFVPAAVALLAGGVAVPTIPIVEQLLAAVVAPMLVAVGARAWQPARVGAYDAYYPAVSATMVVLVIGGVTAANAAAVRANVSLLAGVGVGAVVLNVLGYGVGLAVSRGGSRPTRIASILSVGMRDFAVAAALVIAADLPTIASLPAVAFGVVEMVTSAGLAKRFGSTE